MNIADVDLLTPAPAREAVPPRETVPPRSGVADGPDTAAAEPFDRVLARHAAQDRAASERNVDDRRADDDRGTDPDAAGEARASSTEGARDADGPRSDGAAGNGETDADPQGGDLSHDAADGTPVVAPAGSDSTPRADPAAGSGGSVPGKAMATIVKAGAESASGAAAESTGAKSGATPGPVPGATPESTPAPATTPGPTAAAPSTPPTGTAEAAPRARADAADAAPPAADPADADGEPPAKAEAGRPGAHAKSPLHGTGDGTAKSANTPQAPAPDGSRDGLAKAVQHAAAPAQTALAKAVEAAALRDADAGSGGSGAARGNAIAPPPGAADGTGHQAAQVSSTRAEAARHAATFDQVIDRTLHMVRVGDREANVRLVPEHLGEVRVRITLDRGTVTAHLTVHNAVARDLMEGQQARLEQALLDGGAGGAHVNVSMGGERTAGHARQDLPEAAPRAPVEADPVEAPAPAHDLAHTEAAARGGVSIRA